MDDDDVMRRLGSRICAARRAAGLTLKDVGAIVGSSETTISEVEAGKRGLAIMKLLRIAEAIGSSPAQLLAGLTDAGPDASADVFALRSRMAAARRHAAKCLSLLSPSTQETANG